MSQLPASPNLAHLKKQARQLLRRFRQAEPDALERFRVSLPAVRGLDARTLAARPLRLHDAQSCVAREYGFNSWTELKAFVDWKAASVDREQSLQRWLTLVYGLDGSTARPELAIRMLHEWPQLPGDDPYLACAIGNEQRIARETAANPAWLHEAGGPLKMPPLVAVTHSSLLRDSRYAAALERSASLLLEHGADPNQAWIDPDIPESRRTPLFGAAGRNHHGGMTRILLAGGADPKDAGINPNDSEALYHAVESRDLTCVALMLEAGARVQGTNALNRLLDYRNRDGLQLLLAHGADPNEGYALHHAIRRGCSAEMIAMLLDAGADPLGPNAQGFRPYRYALLYGDPEVAELLRVRGGEEALDDREAFVAACARGDRDDAMQRLAREPGIVQRLSQRQLRQLPNLAARGNLAGVMLMVELGWPIATPGGDWKASALNLAVYRGDAEMARFLLDRGASWTERHGFGNNVVGTLAHGSLNEPENPPPGGGDWLACAETLVAHGMPLPPADYTFSEEVEAYFDSLRDSPSDD